MRRPTTRALVLWLSYWVGLFVIMHTPVVGVGRLRIRFADKVMHVLLYAVLTYLGGRFWGVSTGALTRRVVFVWAAAYAVYGIVDEWLQQFVGRSTSLADWIADVVGIALASVLLLRGRGGGGLSEPACPTDGEPS